MVKNPHRWSGWPGAYCTQCGCADPLELAMVDDHIIYEYKGNFYHDIPEDENGKWPAVEGVTSHIDPTWRHLYPDDECTAAPKEIT